MNKENIKTTFTELIENLKMSINNLKRKNQSRIKKISYQNHHRRIRKNITNDFTKNPKIERTLYKNE